MKEKPMQKKKKYRVWINQVNQTYVDILANGREEARKLGYAKWRREEAHSTVSCVEEQDEE